LERKKENNITAELDEEEEGIVGESGVVFCLDIV
jgi:hypothetical protein